MDERGDGPEVVTLGEVMALLIADPGVPLEVADHFRLGIAGAEATVAIGLSRLGHRAAYAGRLGDDPSGRRIARELRGHGVDTAPLRLVPDLPTGLLVRDAVVDRPISVQYHRRGSAASTMCPEDVPADTIRAASLLHVTGITAALSTSARAAVVRAVDVARDAGTTVSFDPNVRLRLAGAAAWRELVEMLARRSDLVLTGLDDARVVTDGPPAEWFLERGASTVVVKDGAKGAWETDGTSAVSEPALSTRVVDPVGAGDSFAAGWLSGWLRGLPPAERLREAAAVASLAVGVAGDVDGLPDRPLLRRVLGGQTDVDR